MKRTVYIYRVPYDSGFAPCVFENGRIPTDTLTLACCKGGQIRKENKGVNTGLRYTVGKNHWDGIKNSAEEVYVVGVAKSSVSGCDKVVYIAKITDICEMKGYFSNTAYQNRLDCIYTYSTEAFLGDKLKVYRHLKRNGNSDTFHPVGDEGQHYRDELGKFVLLSKVFVYFGKEEKVISQHYMQAGFLPRRQETKHYSTEEPDGNTELAFEFINEYMCDEFYCMKNVKPSIELTPGCKGCNQK